MTTLSRGVPIDPAHAALLIVDVQNYCAHPDSAGSRSLNRQQQGGHDVHLGVALAGGAAGCVDLFEDHGSSA
jgi:nicotinamidase-related amidase